MGEVLFAIEETDDGQFAVVETRPRRIGVFAQEVHAALFMNVMIERPLEFEDVSAGLLTAAFDAETSTQTPTPEEPVEDKPDPEPSPPQPSEAPVPPEPDQEPEPVASTAPPDWERAYRMLAEGADLKTAAAEIGVRWTQLRGKWAVAKSAYVMGHRTVRRAAKSNDPAEAPNADQGGVSGGPEAVMARGSRDWTDADELKLEMAADSGEDMELIAKRLSRTVSDCKRRLNWIRKQREAEIAREMADG